MAKVNKKALVKNIKALNKKKLTKKIKVKGDVEDLQEDFISAIEDIDDNGKIDDVPEAVIDFYEGLIDDEDDDDEKADKGKKKKGKGKKSKSKKDDDEDEDDDDEDEDDDDDDEDEDADEDEDGDEDLEEELEDMTLKELKAYVKDNDIEVDGKITKKTRDAVIKQILAAAEADDDEDEDEDDEDEIDLSELSLKELKAKAKELGYKGKVTKKTRDDVEEALEELMEGGSDDEDDDDDDDEADEFDLDEADVEEIVEYCADNGIKLTKKQKKFKVKKLRKIVAKKMADAGDDDEKSSKGKGKGGGKKRDLPKGLRKNTLPSEIFLAIKEGGDDGTPMSELGELVAKAKNKGKKKKEHKKAMQFYGFVQRTVARKIAAAEGVTAIQIHADSGNEGDAIFKVEEE